MRARSRETWRMARFTLASFAACSAVTPFAESTGVPYTSLANTPLLARVGGVVDATAPLEVTSGVPKGATANGSTPVVPTVVPTVVPVPTPEVVPGVRPFTLEAPASAPSEDVEPLAWFAATASSVCWLRTSTVVVLLGVVVALDVPAPVPDDVATGCPDEIPGALLMTVPVALMLTAMGPAAVVVAAPAVVAKDNAIAAASEADERWRIAISCVVP